MELSESKKKTQILQLGGTQYSLIIATTLMIYCKNQTTLTTEKLLGEMHIQWRFAGGKLKEDEDSNNKNEIALAATNTKKGGKKPNGRGKSKKEKPNKDKICNHCYIKGHIENTCWEKYPEKKPKLAKNCKSKPASSCFVATAAIDDGKGKIILVATSHGEQYVYLDHDVISDDKESILEVFTGQMHAVDITNAYQYAPIINEVKFLEGIKLLEELKEKEYDKEIIGSDDEQVRKIYTVKRDDDDKSQGGVVSLVVCDEAMLHPTMETLVDKVMWIAGTRATSHVTYSRIGGMNHCNTTVKTRRFVRESINPDLERDVLVTYMCDDSKEIEDKLNDVQKNEKFNFNLFSVT